jgi:DNA-binding helix-hairpin-helix protein with protein kinase domain
VAVKWYFPDYLGRDTRLRERIEKAVQIGAPSDRFLWPLEVVSALDDTGFGYIMPLREARFKGIVDRMKCRVDPSFRAIATSGFDLAHSYLQLHAKGLCYRDISFGNVFFDPDTGDVRICDNDNVDVDGQPGGVNGTPRFMAPEIVRGEAAPSTQTDLFSLAVLLFYLLMMHHPLEGRKESSIHSLDLPAMKKLYGDEPVFIYDPHDASNQPVAGYHDNALRNWPIYPKFMRDMFIRAFTDGIRDPQNGRVRESEWRVAMVRLRDALYYCGSCGAENLYDADALQVSGGAPGACWRCKKPTKLPYRIRIGKTVVILNHDTRLYPHHVDGNRMYDFSAPVAEVARRPNNPDVWGLKNLSGEKWVCTATSGALQAVEPGRSVSLTPGSRINFGGTEGEIR